MLLLVQIITMIWKLYITQGLNSFCRIGKAHFEEEVFNSYLEKGIKNWGRTTKVIMCIIHTMVLSWVSFNQRKPTVAVRSNRGGQNVPLLCNASISSEQSASSAYIQFWLSQESNFLWYVADTVSYITPCM